MDVTNLNCNDVDSGGHDIIACIKQAAAPLVATAEGVIPVWHPIVVKKLRPTPTSLPIG